LHQRVEHAALGALEPVPVLAVLLRSQRRDDRGQPARLAQRLRIVPGNHPVADLVDRIVMALPIATTLDVRRQAAPGIAAIGHERVDLPGVFHESQHMAAALAADVFIGDMLVAVVAVEVFQGCAAVSRRIPAWGGHDIAPMVERR